MFQNGNRLNMRRKFLASLVAALAATLFFHAVGAGAQPQGAYPNQTIRLIVPFSPGGLPDTVARIIAPSMQARLKETIIVENRPGSGGGIAATALAAAPPDGHQLIVSDLAFLS